MATTTKTNSHSKGTASSTDFDLDAFLAEDDSVWDGRTHSWVTSRDVSHPSDGKHLTWQDMVDDTPAYQRAERELSLGELAQQMKRAYDEMPPAVRREWDARNEWYRQERTKRRRPACDTPQTARSCGRRRRSFQVRDTLEEYLDNGFFKYCVVVLALIGLVAAGLYAQDPASFEERALSTISIVLAVHGIIWVLGDVVQFGEETPLALVVQLPVALVGAIACAVVLVVGGIVILFAIGIALLPLVLLVFMGAGSDSEDDDDIIPSGTIGMGKPTKAYLTWKVMNDILGDDE